MKRVFLPVLLSSVLLAACIKEPAGFLIEGGNHSITVERNKSYFWSGGWEIDLIVTRYPECQRRYPLKKSGERLRVDLYRTTTGAYILNQGKRWYVAETSECRMQSFEEAPPEPGEMLGTFRVKNEVFQFVPARKNPGQLHE
jgi:hypothetical protein